MGYQEYGKDAMTSLTWHALGCRNQEKRRSSFLSTSSRQKYHHSGIGLTEVLLCAEGR